MAKININLNDDECLTTETNIYGETIYKVSKKPSTYNTYSNKPYPKTWDEILEYHNNKEKKSVSFLGYKQLITLFGKTVGDNPEIKHELNDNTWDETIFHFVLKMTIEALNDGWIPYMSDNEHGTKDGKWWYPVCVKDNPYIFNKLEIKSIDANTKELPISYWMILKNEDVAKHLITYFKDIVENYFFWKLN